MSNTKNTLNPAQASERIVAIDIIRGIALFGVLLINFPFFSGAGILSRLEQPLYQGNISLLVSKLATVLVNAKSFACFSMLFGIGLFIQFERADKRGLRPAAFAIRRLGGLFLIGLAHATFCWWGDVLTKYAIGGFVLILFLRAKPKMLLIAAASFLLLTECLPFLMEKSPMVFPLAAIDSAYGHQGWVECLRLNVGMLSPRSFLANELPTVTTSLAFFFVGATLWKLGLVSNPAGHATTLRRIFHSTMWFGLITNAILFTPIRIIPEAWTIFAHGIPWGLFCNISILAMTVGYFSGLLCILGSEKWLRRMTLLAPVGRMALTNYLAQSIVLVFAFSHYGLGLWGRISPSVAWPLIIAFYAIEVAWSNWWLANFKFGPAEWIWRSMTYGKLQPMIKETKRTHISEEGVFNPARG